MTDNNAPNNTPSVSPVAQDTATSPATYSNTMSGTEAYAKEVVDANRTTENVTTTAVAGKGGAFNGMDILDSAQENSTSALNEVSTAAGMPINNANPGSTATLNSGLSIDPSVIAHTLDKPAPGQTTTVSVQPGDMLSTSFDPDAANLDMQGTNLVMSFNDGSKIVLSNFAADTQNMPTIALPNGSLVAGGIIIAQLQGTDDDLFNLETAAGATLTSGRFAYSDDLGNVIGLLDKLPPIGFTSLQFPQPEPRVTIADDIEGLDAGGSFTVSVSTISAIFGLVNGVFEDWQPYKNVGDMTLEPAAFNIAFTPEDNEVVDQMTIGNIPAGVQFFYGTTGSYAPVPVVNDSVTFTGTQLNSGNIFILNTTQGDIDIPLTVSMLIRDPDTGLTAVLTQNITVITDAVADQPELASSVTIDATTITSGTITGSENRPINLNVNVNYPDVDGSEIHTVILSGVPSQWTLVSAPGLTFTTVTEADGTVTYTAVVTGGNASSVVSFDPHEWTSDINGDAVLTLTARVEEQPSDLELTTANNVAEIATQFTIAIPEDVPTIVAIAVPSTIAEATLTVPGIDQVEGDIVVEFNTDNPGTLELTTDGLDALNLTSQGGDTLTYTLEADGSITARDTSGAPVFTVEVAATSQNGTQQTFTYTFTLLQPVDHPDGTTADLLSVPLNFIATDSDGDTVSGNFEVRIIDDVPTAQDSSISLDETNSLGQTVSGTLVFDLGADGAGAVSANDDFTASGSLTSGTLMSGGVAVDVSVENGQYIGRAGTETVFTLAINSDGSYDFVQLLPLDHADGSDANDVIDLSFGYTVTDFDGDSATSNLIIRIADDAPTAVNDSAAIADGSTIATGNVLDNDSLSNDEPNLVTSVSSNGTTINFATDGATDANGTYVLVDGQYGQLKIYENGQYTYTYDTANFGGILNEQFTYVLVDGDGDSSSADFNLKITDNVPGAAPDIKKTVDESTDLGQSFSGTIVVENASNFELGSESGSNFSAGGSLKDGTLTSNGVPVTVALVNGVYVGSANGSEVFTLSISNDGTYTFVQTAVLDHADGSNPNDVINLNFNYIASDDDGDSVQGNITVHVRDDAPVAIADTNSIPDGSSTASGNVITNDNLSEDEPNLLQSVSGQAFANAASDAGGKFVLVNGDYGQLKIYENGQYTYTYDNANHSGNNTEQFTYVLVDGDGDTSSTTLTLSIIDKGPTHAPNIKEIVDETSDLGQSFSDTIIVQNASIFELGSESGSSFSAGGSLKDGTLTSNGVAVTVALVNGVYVGSANGTEVFTLSLSNNGTYTFVQKAPLDHADGSNPNDVINLNFNYIASDIDGDSVQGSIIINVRDDAPVAVADTNSIPDGSSVASGNVISNDNLSEDTPNLLQSVDNQSFSNAASDAVGKFVLVNGDYGQLKIYENGQYTYTYDNANHTGNNTEQFTYVLVDGDGDTSSTTLTLSIIDKGPGNAPDVVKIIDETTDINKTFSDTITVQGASSFALGAVTGSANFEASGSLKANALTSNGVAVSVSLVGGQYVGVAGGKEVFTLSINNNGTYSFIQKAPLDHADGSNPNDVISLNFNYTARDTDGDASEGQITISVRDDAPVANPDVNYTSDLLASGNVITGENGGSGAADVLSKDVANLLKDVSFEGTTKSFSSPNGTDAGGKFVLIDGEHGQLKIYENGQYTYTVTKPAVDSVREFFVERSDIPGNTKTVNENGITIFTVKGGNLVYTTQSTGEGVGIKGGGGGDKVYGSDEALGVSFADPADQVSLTLSDLGNNIGREIDFKVYFSDNPTDFQVISINVTSESDGFNRDFDFRASDFGKESIARIDISSDGTYGKNDTVSFMLKKVTSVSSNEASDKFGYTLIDHDGDSSNSTLTIDLTTPKLIVGENVDDKTGSTVSYEVGIGSGPISGGASSDILVGDVGGSKVTQQGKDYNVVLVLDVSGSMQGAKAALLKDAVTNLLSDFHDYKGGQVKVHVVPFATDVRSVATFTLTTTSGFNSATNFVNGLVITKPSTQEGYTNYEAPLKSAISWLQGETSNDPIPNGTNFTYFVSDGEPNRYLNGSSVANGNADKVMQEITGSDGSNEVAILQSLSDVVGVGIGVSAVTLGHLNVIDNSHDGALNVKDPHDLSAALKGASPLNHLSDVGNDVLTGGEGNDLIFGDALNTDALSEAYNLGLAKGAGWNAFAELEASHDWSREDTISYIHDNMIELARETVTNNGPRDGGNDIINGGDGNDIIFGQEGDDIINGGAGDDIISGGSGDNVLTGGAGADTFLFLKDEVGTNLITDYSKAENDKLDISDLLTDSSYIPGISQIDDYVKIDDITGSVHVDVSGSGSFNNDNHIATIENVGSLDSVNVILNDDEGARLIHTV